MSSRKRSSRCGGPRVPTVPSAARWSDGCTRSRETPDTPPLAAARPSGSVDAPDRTDPSPTPEDETAEKLEAFQLHVCIDRLPQNEREIIELAYLKGMSQSEIAAELQMPLGTVKTRNRAALLHLAEILEREEHS